MPRGAGLAYQKWYQSSFGKILPHFYVKNIFLAQKLAKLQHFKENRLQFTNLQLFDFQSCRFYSLQSLSASPQRTEARNTKYNLFQCLRILIFRIFYLKISYIVHFPQIFTSKFSDVHQFTNF